MDPAWVRSQAGRIGQVVPESLEALWLREARPFEDFIEAFLFGSKFLCDHKAVRAAMGAIMARLPESSDGPRGLDLWVSPFFLVCFKNLLSLEALWRGIEDGIGDGRQQGVSVAVVIDAVNHLGPEHGHEVLDLVLGDLPNFVVGFSTGGLERVPFREWAPVFDRARESGLRIAAHAGENGPGENVREAILEGGVDRIVHGVHAASDPSILDLLAERRIPVDVCPSSNRALVPNLGTHPLPVMLRAGLRCALGTDDPGLIPCDLTSEWRLAQAMGLNAGELEALRRFSVEDAWCLRKP